METNVDYMTSDRAPAQFMLPSVENVSSEIYNSLINYLIFIYVNSSQLNFAVLILMPKREKIMIKRSSL